MLSARPARAAYVSVQQKKAHLPVVDAHHEEQRCIATVNHSETLVLYEVCLQCIFLLLVSCDR
jgi:hypothetical protein